MLLFRRRPGLIDFGPAVLLFPHRLSTHFSRCLDSSCCTRAYGTLSFRICHLSFRVCLLHAYLAAHPVYASRRTLFSHSFMDSRVHLCSSFAFAVHTLPLSWTAAQTLHFFRGSTSHVLLRLDRTYCAFISRWDSFAPPLLTPVRFRSRRGCTSHLSLPRHSALSAAVAAFHATPGAYSVTGT